MWQKLVWIGLAGAAGTLARFGVTEAVGRTFGRAFPWGALAVNALGCFAFGLAFATLEPRFDLGPVARAAILTGFFGGFTTFSSFGFETAHLLHHHQYAAALGNVLAQNLLGITLAIVGFALGRFAAV